MEFCCRWSALVVAIAAVAAAAAGIDGVIDGNGYWLPFIFFFFLYLFSALVFRLCHYIRMLVMKQSE